MTRPLEGFSLATFVALLAMCVFALACEAEPRAVATAIAQEPTRSPSLDLNLVEHRRAPIAPRVDWRPAASERQPMALTAGDGTGLRLVSVTGTVVIEDPLAFTELHLTFENPEARRREGRFEFELPSGAALSRLAMRIGGRWMEGEVVERARARETFESYIHRRPRVDPALLEQAGVNRVSARVFPIQPRERKQIIISYSQPLVGSEGGDESYRLPLQGLPELDDLDLRVIVKSFEGEADPSSSSPASSPVERVIEVSERGFTPTHDLVVELDGAGAAGALRAGELVALRVQPRIRAADLEDPVESLTVLFDTSGSAALSFERELDRLGAMLEALGEVPVRLVAFDQTVALVHEGPASEVRGRGLAALRKRRAFGASDLRRALTHEALRSASSRRLLIWSDGVATAGEVEEVRLVEAAGELGFERVDAYASSASADRELLGALSAVGPRAGFVVGPDASGVGIVESLARPGFDSVELVVAGAEWSYPRTLDGYAPGDDLVVVARFPHAAPEEVYVGFSDPRLPDHVVPTLEGAAPLVSRAVARARVDELQQQLDRASASASASASVSDGVEVAKLRDELVELAVDNRLLTRHTALLVLESEAEYRRYGIRRTTRRNILIAGAEGMEVLRRREGRRPAKSEEAPAAGGESGGGEGHFLASPHGGAFVVGNDTEDVWGGLRGTEIGEAYGKGGLGLVGTGRGGGGTGEGTIGLGNTGLIGMGGGGGTGAGYGRGSGAGFGGRGKRVPRVRQARAKVAGSLDRDIIRRIVRAHINEVRSCYNMGLTRNPKLLGRVEIQFTILASGKVGSSSVTRSTVRDEQVGQCIARAARRWVFPKPSTGDLVVVHFPFNLDPGGTSGGTSSGRSSWSEMSRTRRRPGDPSDPHGARWAGSAQSGRYGSVLELVAQGRLEQARADAWEWVGLEPDNALALVALGEMLELDNQVELAARVYGSLIDLHPGRADMRRAAGGRLDALGGAARELAIDSYRKAVDQRKDQINGHRLLAWALAKERRYEEALEVLSAALDTSIPAGRFNGVKALLREDQQLIVAAWAASGAELDPALEARLRAGVRPATAPSLRLVASWETDATDVDILVDPLGGGDGRRHADVRRGFGPEAWISRGRRRPAAVSARVRYFNRGAMGYAMGMVSAIAHDGAGNLSFSDRPFVLMEGSGSVELGRFGT